MAAPYRGGVEAVIILEQIHAPLRKGAGVLPFMAVAARMSAAGQVPAAGIHAELQPKGVHIIRQVLHAMGEFGRVRLEAAVCIALLEGPHVINDDVFIACILEARIHHRPGRFHDQRFADIGAEGVPGIPAHGWLADDHSFSSMHKIKRFLAAIVAWKNAAVKDGKARKIPVYRLNSPLKRGIM